ncbi:MAG: hypothetical protein A3J79_07655 [Elusimicrobia bacterium RIFOXYB2_FULL_62_6]|nr:MAG: hypothetical protein A3J79_07655 [Elusimicrobia bacterium RIFOXYB2_FULL_62_6]
MKRSVQILLIAACVLGGNGCMRLFFQPGSRIYMDPANAGMRYEVIKFRSGDGTELTGMFFASSGTALGTIVHMHGNAENMTSHFSYSAWLANEGFNVFIFDYRGYGASGGRATLDGAVMDGVAALDHAVKLPGARADRIIIFGQSLGGAIAVAAVAESGFRPAAMVLEGTFYSYKSVGAAVMRKHWWSRPFSWLPWLVLTGSHSPSKDIAAISCPKLFIHSEKDPVVPFSQGRKLYEAASGAKEFWTLPSGGHTDAFAGQREIYGPRFVAFLKNALGPLPEPAASGANVSPASNAH